MITRIISIAWLTAAITSAALYGFCGITTWARPVETELRFMLLFAFHVGALPFYFRVQS